MEEEVAGVRMAQMAERLADRPDAPVAVVNANLFDSESGTVREGVTVLVSGNRIDAVGEAGSVVIPEGARVIDAAGGHANGIGHYLERADESTEDIDVCDSGHRTQCRADDPL